MQFYVTAQTPAAAAPPRDRPDEHCPVCHQAGARAASDWLSRRAVGIADPARSLWRCRARLWRARQSWAVARHVFAALVLLARELAVGCGRQTPTAHRGARVKTPKAHVGATVKTPRPAPLAGGPGAFVAIGDGRSLYMECVAAGQTSCWRLASSRTRCLGGRGPDLRCRGQQRRTLATPANAGRPALGSGRPRRAPTARALSPASSSAAAPSIAKSRGRSIRPQACVPSTGAASALKSSCRSTGATATMTLPSMSAKGVL